MALNVRRLLAGALLIAGAAVLAVGIWRYFEGPPLEEPATAGNTPNPSETPWHYATPGEYDRLRALGWYEILRFPVLGALLFIGGVILFRFRPRSRNPHPEESS